METQEILETAQLAMLELTEAEAAQLAEAVGKMLGNFEKMNELDVSGLEPTTHVLLKNNRVRPDETAQTIEPDSLIELAPETEDRFISIPNVL